MKLLFPRPSKWSLRPVPTTTGRTQRRLICAGVPHINYGAPILSRRLLGSFQYNTIRNDLMPTSTSTVIRRWKSKKKPSEEDEAAPDGTFMADDMELNMVADEKLQKKPEDWTKDMWKIFTDYMFSVRWDEKNGWGTPSINPMGRFKIHPASKCLNYGVEVFEGMKAYRGNDNLIRLFRPDLYMKRLLAGAKRLHLPTFCGTQLTECIKRLVKMEQEWIPEGEGHNLYVRTCLIGTEACFEYTPSKSAMLYVVLCPVADTPVKPVTVYVDTDHVKSWPGGFGDVKMGGNYGPMIQMQSLAEKEGCKHVMWLSGNESITDLGYMNVFFVVKNESGEKTLVTPPLNGLILNGVFRQSIMELCNQLKLPVVEREVTMKELKSLLDSKKLKEIFGTGTSDTIVPVKSIIYQGSKYDIPTMKNEKPVYRKIKNSLKEIYYGRIDHQWAVRVDDK